MKKIIFSLGVIGAVAVMAVGGTVAFFNDTETSQGNVFIAGSVDLQVDSFGASYNGEDIETPGSAWTSRNLTNQKFFSFDDIKPGDYGMRHISVHVDGNPAWACLLVTNKEDEENDLNDAEHDAGDTTPDRGELSRYLHAFGWQDDDSDGRYDPHHGEKALKIHNDPDADFNSFFDVFYDLDIADSQSSTDPLPPNGPATTRNIAVAWCAGVQSVNHQTGVISCDGSDVRDDAQSDSFSADVVLYGEQVRNNPNFRCADVLLPPL
ncbi:MAG: TasA family protein [bacterium]|nr:TasA family protein [bacterium]MDZ4299904.1 TasA family protein [Candidatus Sungbacteria bacterium]